MATPYLRALRQRPIGRPEVFSGVNDELRIARMIDGFHSDDGISQLGIMFPNVVDQFGLRARRCCNEHCTTFCDCV